MGCLGERSGCAVTHIARPTPVEDDETNDRRAIGDAFGRLLDQIPPERWPMV